jgi:hypothetical protein
MLGTIHFMRAWQIFLLGTAGLVVVLLLPVYERMLAAAGALSLVGMVFLGFLLRPRNDVFYIRTRIFEADLDNDLFVQHEQIAVRVELTRLRLLYLPTMAAVAFLLATYARGTTWKTSLMDNFWDSSSYVIILPRLFVFGDIGILSAWVGERWVLRDADACSAGSVRVDGGRVFYHFVNRSGEYHGGEGVAFGRFLPAELGTLVVYRVEKPDLNRIGMGLLFHRLVVIGRGVTDLGQARSATGAVPAQSEP